MFKLIKQTQKIQKFQNLWGKHFSTINFETKPKICYYKVLNVSADADIKEIKQEYLKLAKKYHPDTNPDEQQTDKFKEIQEAYSILSNKEKRKIYDQHNGLGSYWEYDNVDSSFGKSSENYEDFLNRKRNYDESEEKKENFKDIDEQVDQYFKNKYFKNPEVNKKTPDGYENPFEMTAKLYRTHHKNVESKKDEYEEFYPNTFKSYYDNKEDEKKLKEQGMTLRLIKEFKIPIIIGFTLLTVQGIIKGVILSNQEKETIEKVEIVKDGRGYRTKMLPLNVV